MMKTLLFLFSLCFAPLFAFCQLTHEGAVADRMKIGRHVWKDQEDRIKAEVVYDEKGVLLYFRTFDNNGLLMDDERMDPKRKRMTFPPLDMTYEEDGFGYVLIPGRAAADAPKARKGERVAVYYEGVLQDGTVFDGNYGDKKPYRFRFQMGEMIPGFDRAVEMLKVGEEGYFWIPSELAYGPDVAGIIPPFSDLLFKIKLVDLN